MVPTTVDVEVPLLSGLAARLAYRGAPSAPNLDDRLAPGPPALQAKDGSLFLNVKMQDLLADVLRRTTVIELREVCRLSGVADTGTKDELVRRIAYQREYNVTSADLRMTKRKSLSARSELSPFRQMEAPQRQQHLPDAPVDLRGPVPMCRSRRQSLPAALLCAPSLEGSSNRTPSPICHTIEMVVPSTDSPVVSPRRRRISVKSGGVQDAARRIDGVDLHCPLRPSCRSRRHSLPAAPLGVPNLEGSPVRTPSPFRHTTEAPESPVALPRRRRINLEILSSGVQEATTEIDVCKKRRRMSI